MIAALPTLGALMPSRVMADTRKVYGVPLTSSLIVADACDEPVSDTRICHVTPPSVLESMA